MYESKQTADRSVSYNLAPSSAVSMSIKISDSLSATTIATYCIVCKDSVDLTKEEECMAMYGKPMHKVCDNCRKAILEMRRQIGC